ncbi:Arylsulfatase A [Halovenus aranensis]|uniref:Arylsulfatase A n=1 Tax=Halovenus aranensis TaxID=890420 RepID=A0A1G8ZMW7_9EURY|nr:sulfatase [Halovenus aranensis]SDK16472.1 Arylsulfatase A [Halovenus aranensis]
MRNQNNPNIVLIVLDSTRVDHLSCYEYGRETTPYLEKFTTDAVQYKQAFSAAPWTPPSHASMFTGQYPSNHKLMDSHMSMNVDFPTLAEFLNQNGYNTFGISPSAKLGAHTDLSDGFSDYFEMYRIPEFPKEIGDIIKIYLKNIKSWGRLVYNHIKQDGALHEFQASILKKRMNEYNRKNEPFFGFTNFLCAHNPYNPPQKFKQEFKSIDYEDIDMKKINYLSENGLYQYLSGETSVTEEEWTVLKDWYDAAIARADAKIEEVVEYLKKIGAYDDTLIIITADHGEHFGENSRVYHHFSVYDELIHVPLIVKYPNQKYSNTTVNKLVSLTDLYPTIYQLLTSSKVDKFDGTILPPLGDQEREFIFSEYGEPVGAMDLIKKYSNQVSQEVYEELYHGLQCCRTLDQKYIKVSGGDDEFYNLYENQSEKKNLIHESKEEIDKFKQAIESNLSTLPSMTADYDTDKDIRENLKELGYL